MMTDLQRRAFEAGKRGMLLSQFLNGVPEKDKVIASMFFAKGVIAQKQENRKNDPK